MRARTAVGVVALAAGLVMPLHIAQTASASTDAVVVHILPTYCNGAYFVASVDVNNPGDSDSTVKLFLNGSANGSVVVPAGGHSVAAFDLGGLAPSASFVLEAKSGSVVLDSATDVLAVCSPVVSGDAAVAGCSFDDVHPVLSYFLNNDGFSRAPVTVMVDDAAMATVDVDAGGVTQGRVELPSIAPGQYFTTTLVSDGVRVFAGASIGANCSDVSTTPFSLARTGCTAVNISGVMDSATMTHIQLDWSNDGARSTSFTGRGVAGLNQQWSRSLTAIGKLPPGGVDVTLKVAVDGLLVFNQTSALNACTPPVEVATPLVRGSAKVGATLTCVGTYRDATGVRYRWSRDGKALSGASKLIYAATGADYRHRVSCASRAYNAAGWTATANSSRLLIAGKGAKLKLLARPTVAGQGKVGQKLKVASVGRWNLKPSSLSCRWMRNGTVIRGATHCVYRLTSRDRGRSIAVRVTAVRYGYASARGSSRGHKVG